MHQKEIISRLRDEQSDKYLFDIKTIINCLGNLYFTRSPNGKIRKFLRKKAIVTAKYINSKREYSASANATDYETLRRVWTSTRANDLLNEKNKIKIKQGIFDALADCIEDDIRRKTFNIYCVDGRISRLLGALVLLDHDPRNWNLNRLDDLKNELFTLGKETIRKCALEAAEDSDTLIAAVGKPFLAQTLEEIEQIGEIDPETDNQWQEKTKKKIQNVLEDRIKEINTDIPNSIPSRFEKQIIDEALAAF